MEEKYTNKYFKSGYYAGFLSARLQKNKYISEKDIAEWRFGNNFQKEYPPGYLNWVDEGLENDKI